MPKVSPIQSSFNAGEVSPLVQGRVDAERYKAALATCLNYIPSVQGGLVRRSGTYYVDNVNSNSYRSRLVPFEYSTDQAYVIEFANNDIYFFKDRARLYMNDNVTKVSVGSGYAIADVYDLKFTQSADVLYITHPDYAPKKLSRISETQWTLEAIDFQDGPYLDIDDRGYTLTPGAATGTGITLTAGPSVNVTGVIAGSAGYSVITASAHGYSAGDRIFVASVGGTTEVNGTWTVYSSTTNTITIAVTFVNAYTAGGTIRPAIFDSTDNGRLIRMKEGSTWGWAKMASFTDAAHITIDIQSTLTNTNAKSTWRLGVWSGYVGFPSCVVFHEDRLCFSGAAEAPQRVDCSNSGDYENFAPSDMSGTATASSAVAFIMNSNDVNAVRWITSDEKGLLPGSVGGEWVVKGTSGEALSPTNVNAKRATSFGSSNVQPVQVGKSTIFVQRSGRKVREFNYFYDVDGFRATDLSLLSEHITESGIVQMAYQKEPQPIVWCVRTDGVLCAMTYERDVDNLKVGWARHIIGGQDELGEHARVESVAVIPSPDGTTHDVWLIVRRYINGSYSRCVEYITPTFDDSLDQREAFFVDCGLTYDQPKTISDITNANPAVVTCNSHGFNNGDTVYLSDISNMTELNGRSFTVANKTANTFELSGENSTSYGDYLAGFSGGYARKYVSTVSGLTHLEGQTVDVFADGEVQPSKTVSSGAITLTAAATTIHVGLNYVSDAQMLRLDAGAADGTALGKTRRMNRVGMLLHRTLGLKIGTDFDNLFNVNFRQSGDSLNEPTELFSGIISENLEADYDFENQFCWRQDTPLPGTILAVMPQMTTQDR